MGNGLLGSVILDVHTSSLFWAWPCQVMCWACQDVVLHSVKLKEVITADNHFLTRHTSPCVMKVMKLPHILQELHYIHGNDYCIELCKDQLAGLYYNE